MVLPKQHTTLGYGRLLSLNLQHAGGSEVFEKVPSKILLTDTFRLVDNAGIDQKIYYRLYRIIESLPVRFDYEVRVFGLFIG